MGNNQCHLCSNQERSPSNSVYTFQMKPSIEQQQRASLLHSYQTQLNSYKQKTQLKNKQIIHNKSSNIQFKQIGLPFTTKSSSNVSLDNKMSYFHHQNSQKREPKQVYRTTYEPPIAQLPMNGQKNLLKRAKSYQEPSQSYDKKTHPQSVLINSSQTPMNHFRVQSNQFTPQFNSIKPASIKFIHNNVPNQWHSIQTSQYQTLQQNHQIYPITQQKNYQSTLQRIKEPCQYVHFNTNVVQIKNQSQQNSSLGNAPFIPNVVPMNDQVQPNSPLGSLLSFLPRPASNKQSEALIKTDKSIQSNRQLLQVEVNLRDDFLAHHLKYELTLSEKANMKQIRRRQIIEHHWVKKNAYFCDLRTDLGVDLASYGESLYSSWMQRVFLQIWEQAHDNFFNKHLDYKFVRNKVSEQYMFQLYQLKQFGDAGLTALNFFFNTPEVDMNCFMQYSDDALLYLFKKLKERYPQTGDGGNDSITFPDVPTTKTNLNLFDNFPSLSFTDPDNLNYQTIFEDINFLLKKAIEQQQTFKADMKQILGQDVLACPKVGEVTKQGLTSFNACAVRRVFVKWAENLLEKCPQLYNTKSFLRFIQARQKIVNNFIFKSNVQSTTHKIVIDCVSLLLEAAKYTIKDRQQRKEFIFNIYDLLRCKIKRNTPEQIVALLEKMQNTSTTKSGKKFSVVRIKNRFKTNNRDLLINFRYGEVLVGEAQLCVDNAHISKQAKLNYDFCHYIYELERSLFGPTLELMMEYEDFQRPDITINFQAQNLVQERASELIEDLQQIDRKCLHGHTMISLIRDIIFNVDDDMDGTTTIVCNYCDSSAKTTKRYDYCYLCACVLCTDCREQYKTVDPNKFYLTVEPIDIPQINIYSQLMALITTNRSMIVLFWLESSSASEMFKDVVAYHQSKLRMQQEKYVPHIALVKHSPQSADLCNRYGVKDFPTMILLNEQAESVRTIIGMNWFQAAVIYKMQQLLLEGESIETGEYCLDYDCSQEYNTPMQKKPIDQEHSSCQTCLGASQSTYLPMKEKGNGMYCQNNHFRCLNCCYASLPTPTVYRDFMGLSYLSTTLANDNLRCPRGHQLILNKNKPSNQAYNCCKCGWLKLFDNENGIGQCSSCKVFLCPRCMGLFVPTLLQLTHSTEIARHYVSCTAEETTRCVCNRNFKKCYSSIPLTLESYKLHPTSRQPWVCVLCQQPGREGSLHLACFVCQKYGESKGEGEKANFQICIVCAQRSKLLGLSVQKKVKEKLSEFLCPSDKYQLLETSFSYNKQLTIKCHYCSKTYFSNSERFYCKQCGLNFCKDCQQQLLNHTVIPTCQQKCPNGHQLLFGFVKREHMQFCDGCWVVIKEQKFGCAEDEYRLCKNCVKNNPPDFIGNAFMKKATSMLNMNTLFADFGIGSSKGKEINEEEIK